MTGRWKWIVLVLIGCGLILSSQGSRSFWKRRRYFKQLEQKLADVRRQNQSLTAEIQRYKTDPRAIEQIARRDLGMIQPGEIEYRFVVDRSSD